MSGSEQNRGTPGRTLLLLRHGTASYADPQVDDHDAPLAASGREDVERLGRYLAARGRAPARVLCSSARRTQETWACLAPSLSPSVELEVLPDLYLASPDTLVDRVASAPAEATELLVVAHNPGIAALSHALAEGADAALRERMRSGFAPASLACFAAAAETWQSFPRAPALLDFVHPADLDGEI